MKPSSDPRRAPARAAFNAFGVIVFALGIDTALAASPAKPAASAAPAAPATCHATDANFFKDQGLLMKVTTKLQFNKQLLAEKIDVKANGGVVSLSGGVSTPEHIALAGDLARQVSGVTCVNNFLKVGPPTPGPERTIN